MTRNIGGGASGARGFTPGRNQTRGDYTRHCFSYVVPAGEAGAGESVSIILFSEFLVTKDWSLTSLKEKLIKIGAKVVSHGRYVAFQMAEVAIPRQMFQEILRLIAELRPQPPPAPA